MIFLCIFQFFKKYIIKTKVKILSLLASCNIRIKDAFKKTIFNTILRNTNEFSWFCFENSTENTIYSLIYQDFIHKINLRKFDCVSNFLKIDRCHFLLVFFENIIKNIYFYVKSASLLPTTVKLIFKVTRPAKIQTTCAEMCFPTDTGFSLPLHKSPRNLMILVPDRNRFGVQKINFLFTDCCLGSPELSAIKEVCSSKNI